LDFRFFHLFEMPVQKYEKSAIELGGVLGPRGMNRTGNDCELAAGDHARHTLHPGRMPVTV
jgi:hypothetical protein